MTIMQQPNLLLEALSYLGRRANGSTWEHIEHRIHLRKIDPAPSFLHTMEQLKNLSGYLNDAIHLDAEELTELFGNIEGFPHNTIGSSSVAFLLFYPLIDTYEGNADQLLSYLHGLSADHVAYHIAFTLDLTDRDNSLESFGEHELIDSILSLSIPDKSKLAILGICHNYHSLADRIAAILFPAVRILEQHTDLINTLSSDFAALVEEMGPRHYLEETSHLELCIDSDYIIRPFLFGMDTTLASELLSDRVFVYCGILRKELLTMLTEQRNSGDDIYEAYRLLGDRTRFDILCYLRGRSAYGQELCEHFSLSRNTIHHHMSKMISSGLVTCIIDGNRTYYTLDKEAFSLLIHRQEELFL